jgi:hypothetical protein
MVTSECLTSASPALRQCYHSMYDKFLSDPNSRIDYNAPPKRWNSKNERFYVKLKIHCTDTLLLERLLKLLLRCERSYC